MFCKNCGNKLRDDDVFCPKCAFAVNTEQLPAEVQNENEKNKAAKSLFIWGIVAASVEYIGLGIVGVDLILAVVVRKMAKDYAAKYGEPTGKAKIGSMLATIAFWCALVTNVLALLTLIGSAILLVVSTLFSNAFQIIFDSVLSEFSGIFKEAIMQMF